MGIELLLGHLVGDYLLQTNGMAVAKKNKGIEGFMACLIHCLLYTLAICVFIGLWSWLGIVAVFASHWVVDRYTWLSWLHKRFYGRMLADSCLDGTVISPELIQNISIGAFVYIVMDNTIHLVLVYLIYWLL